MSALTNALPSTLANTQPALTNTQEKIMPVGGKKDGTVAFRAVIGVLSIAEGIISSIFIGKSTPDDYDIKPKKEIPVQSIFSVIFTILDFGFSAGSGYGCYSPMEYDGNSNLPYQKSDQMKTVNKYSNLYSSFWLAKTTVCLADGIANIAASFNGAKLWAQGCKIFSSYVCAPQYALMYIASAGIEIAALIASGMVSTNDKDSLNDKTVFQVETSAYIADDLKSIVDCILTFPLSGKAIVSNAYAKGGFIIGRGILSLGYSGCMFATAGIIGAS